MNKITLFMVLVVITAVVFGIWQAQDRQYAAKTPSQKTVTVSSQADSSSLGGKIYSQTANPVGNNLPQTNPASSPDPFSGYTNPFGQ